MENEKIYNIYKLPELEEILKKCEDDIYDRINELKIKEGEDEVNFLLHTIGKSFVSTREVMALCLNGFPDGALSISRNIYEQFIITYYIEARIDSEDDCDLLKKYNEDYSYQRAKALKYEAMYITKNNKNEEKYRTIINEIKKRYGIHNMKDYWWAKKDGANFNDLCEFVANHNKDMEHLLRSMHLLYKRACLALHASSMGNMIRLGSDNSGVDMGPWEKGQENSLFLTTASLVYIIASTYAVLEIDVTEVKESLNDLIIYYNSLLIKA